MRSIAAMVMALSIAMVILACGGGEYGEAIEVNQKFVDAMESYLDEVEKADSGSAVAAAINAYAEKVEKLAPRMKAVSQKYPEWEDRTKIPEALKPLTEKAENLSQRMAGSFMTAMQYMQDAKVQAAQQRLAKAMGMMQ